MVNLRISSIEEKRREDEEMAHGCDGLARIRKDRRKNNPQITQISQMKKRQKK